MLYINKVYCWYFVEYPTRDNQSISSSTGDINDDSNASSPAQPPSHLSELNQKHHTENGTKGHIIPSKRKHEEIEEPDNTEENGNRFFYYRDIEWPNNIDYFYQKTLLFGQSQI